MGCCCCTHKLPLIAWLLHQSIPADKKVNIQGETYSVYEPLLNYAKCSEPSASVPQEPPQLPSCVDIKSHIVRDDLLEITKFIKEQGLDNALHNFMQWTKNAVSFDTLEHVDKRSRCSSSAIDVMQIFYENKAATSNMLRLGDSETAFKCGAMLTDNLCRCTTFYGEEIRRKAEGMSNRITPQWCTLVNNIKYISHSLTIFLDQLVKDLKPLTQHRKQHLHELIQKAVTNLHKEAMWLLNLAADRLTFKVQSSLDDLWQADKMTSFLDSNLQILYSQLNKDDYNYVLTTAWKNILRVLQDKAARTTHTRNHQYFTYQLNVLYVLTEVFKDCDQHHCLSQEDVTELERQLVPRTLSTYEYIQLYYTERVTQQEAIRDAHLGKLTVRSLFIRHQLCLEVLNGNNIKSLHREGSCELYLKIQLLPKDKFKSAKFRSKMYKASECPHFTQTAAFLLTSVQCASACSVVRVSLKERRSSFLSRGFLLGETFVSFRNITSAEPGMQLQDIPTVQIPLSLPDIQESRILKALVLRLHDDKAKKFVKKEKAKLS